MNQTLISTERLKQLEKDSLLLNCLECAGVDNWDGYDIAVDDYNNRTENNV